MSACTGEDGEAATAWLKKLTKELQRGEFRSEVAQVKRAIETRQAEAAGCKSGNQQVESGK